MKKINIIICLIVFAITCHAQVNHNPGYQTQDTSKIDSAHVQNINKMPMDSSNNNTILPFANDTIPYRRSGDDEDPKRYNPKRN